jgi:hypothetical protein
VFTHDFRLCFKAVPLSVAGNEDEAPFAFMCEKNNMQQVFQAEVGDEYAVGVPYPPVAVYRKAGDTVAENLHCQGLKVLERLLRTSKQLTTIEHKGGSYISMGSLHEVDVPEGWGVLVMLHGATKYSEDKVSQCTTQHSAITGRMERLVIEDDKPGDWETWFAKHLKDAAAFDGSFA